MIEALFVDRDGTIIEDKHYLADPQGVCLLPYVGESLKRICDAGIKIFIVTNQSGIGRGYFQESDFWACQDELAKQLKAYGVSIADTAFCPHEPEINCSCRKPELDMWHALAKKHGLQPELCAMIGDKKDDVGFGINANFALSCLIATGNGIESSQALGINIKDTVTPFIPNFAKQTKTTCISAKDFQQFTEYLLNNMI